MGIVIKNLVRVSIGNWFEIYPRVCYYNCTLFCFLCSFGSKIKLMMIDT